MTDMFQTFFNCRNLTSLDISNFDIRDGTNMTDAFFGCSNLTTVGLIYANIDTINKLPTPSISTIYIDTNINQTAYTGSSKLKVYEQRTVTINIPTALRSNDETADRIYWNDEDKHYYIEQNINPNTNETLETPNIIASGVKQPIYLKTYEDMLSVGIQNIDASYMSINVPFFEIPTDYEYKWEDELDYIKQSFELRFPDEDDVPGDWGFMGIPGEEGTGLKALIDWVDNCKDEEFVRDFDQHFNRDYTLRYFLLVITLG
jgi:surface protein